MSRSQDSATPLISVIALSYNQRRWVLDTLQSIQQQAPADFELIYCDDASKDGTAQRAEAWLQEQAFPFKTIVHQENKGICRTLNEALALSRGRYVQLIACDDMLLPRKLQSQVDIFESCDENVALVYSDAYLIDDDGKYYSPGKNSLRGGFSITPSGPTFDSLVERNFINAASALIRADVIRALGGFDESLRYEDYDLWLRITKKYEIVTAPDPMVLYRVHRGNLSLSIKPQEVYSILRKHVDREPVRHRLRAIAFSLLEAGQLSKQLRADFLQWSTEHSQGRLFSSRLLSAAPGLCGLAFRFRAVLRKLFGRRRRISETINYLLARFEAELECARELSALKLDHANIEDLKARIAHLRERLMVRKGCKGRLRRIREELAMGRYHTFSGGRISAIRDLIGF